jgi:hypothetical protein
VIMSDIQQYLLDYDRNRKEATETAQKSATRMFGGAWWDGNVLIVDRTERWAIEAHKPRDRSWRVPEQRRWRIAIEELVHPDTFSHALLIEM